MHTSIVTILALLASVEAANVVHQRVVYSGPGVADVVGNGFGCANIKLKTGDQLGCVKHVFTDGFTVGITDKANGGRKVTLCSIKGTKGACGPKGINVQVDLTGGTGKVPPPSGAAGTTCLSAAQLSNRPIRRSVEADEALEDLEAEEDEDEEDEDAEDEA